MSNMDVTYKTVSLGEIDMFYREAGNPEAPTILLLHGFPTSSHMYRNLIPELAKKYHVIAPDLPGFGSTKAPRCGQYDYSFDNLYKAVEALTQKLSLQKYVIMLFDYGAPVGFRLAAASPTARRGMKFPLSPRSPIGAEPGSILSSSSFSMASQMMRSSGSASNQMICSSGT
ncbi:MAG: alpha/beta fold hydrolase [Alphaproteobacteria bacterium]|nr:MAG: alpha/beta fold hydrolase [Alphaproteobacteria bacterium]